MTAEAALSFRAVMGRFATGVTVVTATGERGPVGMTANAVCSLSIDPLLVLVCFDNRARTLEVVRDTGRFGVNVLAAGQEALAQRFAVKAPDDDKFSGIVHHSHDGIPVLDGVHAWMACRLEDLMPGGDHTIGIGAPTAIEAGGGEPLLWYRGAYGRFAGP